MGLKRRFSEHKIHKRVIADGVRFDAQTGHHHQPPVLMTIKTLEGELAELRFWNAGRTSTVTVCSSIGPSRATYIACGRYSH